MKRIDQDGDNDGRWALVSDIFDKIKKSIGVGVDTVGAKSKELWDTTVIRTRISELKTKRRELLEDLGGLAFEMLSKGSLAEPVLRAKADAIREIDRQIAAAEEEIQRIREAAREQPVAAEQAKQSEPTEEPETGEDPEPVAAPDEPEMATTCECGAVVLEGARFCVACGRPVSED
ncbi:MAG TPA: hypothetical protein DCL63_04895 [Firmicutes bacterium]|jgi:septal ring factor EnvC (AmiA/AmiB activator)|nr:hypothetical protein [Bacillota bacterium]